MKVIKLQGFHCSKGAVRRKENKMNELTIIGNENDDRRMSSREIAELTGKRHADVMRDIRRQIEQQDLAERNFASSYLDPNNQARPCFNLDYEQTMILITGYSIPLRAKVVRRWQELEKGKPQLTREEKLAEAFMLAQEVNTELQQKNAMLEKSNHRKDRHLIKQAEKIEADAPKVEYHEKLMSTEGLKSITAVAGELGIGRNNLYKILREEKVLYPKGDNYNLPYINKRTNSKGEIRFEVKKYDWEGQIKHKTMCTELGQYFIHRVLERRAKKLEKAQEELKPKGAFFKKEKDTRKKVKIKDGVFTYESCEDLAKEM